MRCAAIFFALVAVAAAGWYFKQQTDSQTGTQTGESMALPAGALAAVNLPSSFTEQEQIGASAYDAVCAACHGLNGQGQDGIAPPLVHKIYEPSHHGDMAFVLAAQNGVRAHHWKFGNMPAVEGVTRSDILDIVAYIRVLQRANGIN
ncbi:MULTISPECIES: c-type cytochrome [Roseobacteraceae]|jgi:mono/diheme cytochrome c family protein|nr:MULTISPECIES: cytochrome c [Roseobacteraceae]MCZ4258444.1 cytochrome c [Sulfitobacter sp. G21635-S1]EAQ23329.1 cytochrome c family protein [Roseovarius sp. 217]MCA0138472.1 cytochrome c [Pseudosulfitobacter pseudonitzschiae]MCD2314078.1 cytochrome c [Pseudosulfitobacter pseudonitzschiae]MCD2330057.1 cytochrome c [Pseudosulfitobacter pseudonitzschiae]